MALLTPQEAIQRMEEAEAEHRKILDIKRYIHRLRIVAAISFFTLFALSVFALNGWSGYVLCSLFLLVTALLSLTSFYDDGFFESWVSAQEREGVTISDIEQERIREKLQIKK
jgi:hypothetical protein